MTAFSKRLYILLLVLAGFLVIPLAYSTARGYTQWWLMSGGHVTVNGVRAGYMHTNWSHSAVMITRTDSSSKQSYLVRISGEEFVGPMVYCGDWHAPRVPAFPIGDVNPPCMGILDGPDPPGADRPRTSTLIARPRFVEFSTAEGKKVTATW
jgi:hypothetical protein